MHNICGAFLAALYPLSCLHPSVRRGNMALPQKAAEKQKGGRMEVGSLKENFYDTISLDAIIDGGITDAARTAPDFVTENEKMVMAALTEYTKDILGRNGAEADDDEVSLIMEERAEKVMDMIADTAHAYIKNGMRLGAHLLLQLLNLE